MRVALLLAVAAAGATASATELSGRLTGRFADWGPCHVQALQSRDFAVAPLGEVPVEPTGAFRFDLPEGTKYAYLALYPEHGAWPLLLRELPVTVPSREELVFPLPGPPRERDARHSVTGPSTWLLGGGLLALLALVVLGGRWLLARYAGRGTDRWVPEPVSAPSGGRALAAVTTVAVGLLMYGVFALDEAMDLLEATYFQEAFAGTTPWAVALSPEVAERAHAPGYAVLLWCLTQVGRAEWWLRLPSVLAAAGAALLLYRLAAGGTSSRAGGLIVAALGALAPLAMRYGRDLTPYSLVGLLAVATTWLLWRALQSGRRRDFALFAGLSTLAFFLHYFTAFMVVGQAAAVLWLWLRGGRGPFWTARLREALLWFGALGALPVVWSAQLVRAFVISAEDNLVTHAVYPEAPSFFTFVGRHLGVLLGLPPELDVLAWPLLAVVGAGYWLLLRDRPAFGRLLLVPLVLVVGLLATSYLLHAYAYGGHVYYGWRWLRPYTAAIAIPLAWLLVRPLPRAGRLLALAGGGTLAVATAFAGVRSAVTWERPAAALAAERIRAEAQDHDAVAVLPAAFYAPGLGYYLEDRAEAAVRQGPAIWKYVHREGGDVRVFGPIRSFGIPLESLAEHVDIRRLWVVVYREEIFGQPEFDPALPAHVLAALDERLHRVRRWSYPHLDLVLYERRPARPGPVRIDLDRLYRSLRWLPDALDPDRLMALQRSGRSIGVRVPSVPGGRPLQIRIAGAADIATPGDVAIAGASLRWDGRTWTGDAPPSRGGVTDLVLERTERAREWPLVLELTP